MREVIIVFTMYKIPLFEMEARNSTGMLKRFKTLFKDTKLTGFSLWLALKCTYRLGSVLWEAVSLSHAEVCVCMGECMWIHM